MKPMLCASADDVPIGDYALEPKFDGWRYLVHSTGRGVVSVAGRDASDYSGKLPYIEREIAKCLPPDTCLDGELIGSSWGDVQSVMGTDGAHIPTKGTPGLQFVVFDVLRCNGQDTRSLPWTDRRAILDAATFEGYVRPTDVYDASARAYQVAVTLGFEGVVCKLKDSPYANGRSSSWVKIKVEGTMEARVVGFKPGTGSNAGTIGALEIVLLDENDMDQVGPNGKQVKTRASGFSDVQRREMLDHPERWLGKIVEIKHNGVLGSGKVRHPSFLRLRDDRAAGVATPPKRAPQPRATQPGTWVRNYGAMGDAKLLQCVRELESSTGDATARVRAKQGDVAYNAARAREAAVSKGLLPPGAFSTP